MELNKLKSEGLIFALDIGTRSVIGTVGVIREKKFEVIAESYREHNDRAMIDGQIHDVSLVTEGVKKVKDDLEEKLGKRLDKVSIAAAGRFLRTTSIKSEISIDPSMEIDKNAIRSLELTAVKKAEDKVNGHTNGKLYCVGYSVKSYFLNGYVISNLLAHKGENISVEIIATFLPRSVVDSLYAVMNRVELTVQSLTLEPIAAMEAAVPSKLRLLNLTLVDIGAGTSDIAISSGGAISAYGMVPQAGDEVTEVIAQNLLVDFNTAERVKRECCELGTSQYTDILGIDNTIDLGQIKKITCSTVQKICIEVSTKIKELNGGKTPNAVFLVGGGAHTPGLVDELAALLELPVQRISIRGRDTVEECHCTDNSLGSTGVTVLGIALIAIKNIGHDFIDVVLNDKVISLFNSHKHSVMDVLLQAGINPRILIGKSGRNIKFTLNGIKRVAFGTLGTNAVISINGKIGNLDSEIKEGDRITIDFAKDGKDAKPKVLDYVSEMQSISFFLNDSVKCIDPLCLINDEPALLNVEILDGDEVYIGIPSTVENYIKYINPAANDLYRDGVPLHKDYVIKEGDRLHTVKISIDQSKSTNSLEKTDDKLIKEKNSSDSNSSDFIDSYKVEQSKSEGVASSNYDIKVKSIQVETKIIVNGSPVILKNKLEYVFIDVFDFIDFDLSKVRGKLMLMLNDNKAGFHDPVKNGDVIKIYWE